MKYILIPILTLFVSIIAIIYILSKNKNDNKISTVKPLPNVFHIRVIYNAAPYADHYRIEFTNNNYLTTDVIKEVFEYKGSPATHQIFNTCKTFKDKDEAIELAKALNTYQKCVEYNNDVEDKYHQLMEYRKANPLKESEYFIKDEPKKEIKPIVIY